MNRLTFRDANGEAWYSDAGTEADRLHFIAGMEDLLGGGYDLDRLRELVEADRDGRCIVIPPNGFTSKDAELALKYVISNRKYQDICPTRAHETDAGLDLYAAEDQEVPAYGSAIFDTGVHVQLPPFTAGLIVSKSGLNFKRDIVSDGLIDIP